MNPKVNFFFGKGQWQEETRLLREIALSCGLDEELKWGVPCYTLDKKNVVLIHTFKEYCAVLFFKGALMKDPKGILIQQTENVQAARQARFTNAKEITKLKSALKTYIKEAMTLEKSGQKVELKKTTEFTMPEEFQTKLQGSPGLKKAFAALTPGRQRGYLLYFSSAKQARTREARVEKYIPKILDGFGLED
jgi:uncharacterized protein YdeI (YjbR/CyaY-like superfamily)